MPAYEVLIPSLHDGLTLNCRLRYGKSFGDFSQSNPGRQKGFRGAIIAHPYAPFGGSQDDHVVTETAKTLLKCGYVVLTFNFRGAGDSQGKCSWSGKGEMDDFVSAFGFLVHYLDHLSLPDEALTLSPVLSERSPNFDEEKPFSDPPRRRHVNHIVLAGYSFGSLIMARLPDVDKTIERFADAQEDSIAVKICERARHCAETDHKILDNRLAQNTNNNQADTPHSPKKHREKDSRLSVGGEDTNPSGRQRSQDSRRSGESRRSEEIVRSIMSHVPHHGRNHSIDRPSNEARRPTTSSTVNQPKPIVKAAYLVISPVLFPFTTFLAPPGLSFGRYDNQASGLLSNTSPVYAVYGDKDSFTAATRLDHWAKKLKQNNELVRTEKIHGAGHFWDGTHSDTLQKGIDLWLRKDLLGTG